MSSEIHDSQALGAELERLFEQTPAPPLTGESPASPPPLAPSNVRAGTADAAATDPPGSPASTASSDELTAALQPVIDRAVRVAVEAAVADTQRTVEAAVERAVAPLAASLREAGAEGDRFQQDMDLLRTQLDAAFDQVETIVGQVAVSVRALADRPAVEPVAAVDLDPLVDQVQRLHEDVAAQIADSRKALRSDLARLTEGLGDRTLEVDTRRLEEVVHRGAIANAADIANLSSELEGLIAAIKAHDTNLSDLRKQIEWIKQRVLSR